MHLILLFHLIQSMKTETYIKDLFNGIKQKEAAQELQCTAAGSHPKHLSSSAQQLHKSLKYFCINTHASNDSKTHCVLRQKDLLNYRDEKQLCSLHTNVVWRERYNTEKKIKSSTNLRSLLQGQMKTQTSSFLRSDYKLFFFFFPSFFPRPLLFMTKLHLLTNLNFIAKEGNISIFHH